MSRPLLAGLGRGALVAGIVLVAGSCSRGDEAPFATPAPLASSTTEPREGTLADPSEEVANPDGRPPAEIRAELNQAVDDEEVCALIDALNSATPDVSDPAAVVAVYRELADATKAAEGFIPAPLAEPWVAVVAASAKAADAAERSGGDIGDPALQAAFGTSEFESALAEVDAWAVLNCP